MSLRRDMALDDFLLLGQNAIITAVLVSSPILVLGLLAGLAVSIFQAATQINDAALAFIPKILSAVLGLVFFGHFMITRISSFTQHAYELIAQVGAGGM
jgi:flagellar biosynthetic protein FliQ